MEFSEGERKRDRSGFSSVLWGKRGNRLLNEMVIEIMTVDPSTFPQLIFTVHVSCHTDPNFQWEDKRVGDALVASICNQL